MRVRFVPSAVSIWWRSAIAMRRGRRSCAPGSRSPRPIPIWPRCWLDGGSMRFTFSCLPARTLPHLGGAPDSMEARADQSSDRRKGVRFFRGGGGGATIGATCVDLRFGFAPGFAEHQTHVRGWGGTATADFENDVYVVRRH